jgi:hypothetical protein
MIAPHLQLYFGTEDVLGILRFFLVGGMIMIIGLLSRTSTDWKDKLLVILVLRGMISTLSVVLWSAATFKFNILGPLQSKVLLFRKYLE